MSNDYLFRFLNAIAWMFAGAMLMAALFLFTQIYNANNPPSQEDEEEDAYHGALKDSMRAN